MKIWRSVILSSFGAVVVGIGVAAAFIALLSFYGTPQEVFPAVAAQSLKFPENEKMLDAVAEKLAHDGAALSTIEPATGSNARNQNTNANPAPKSQ